MKFYHYNKCGTCRKAKKFLDDHGISYQETDITLNPPPKSILKKALQAKGIKKLFNTSGVEYREKKIKDKIGMITEAQALDLLAASGRLIKRPVTVDGKRLTVGFDPKEFKEVWAK
ncbi:MAG: Spx/MgsR family RNA polymerase-binding regulatory protein [Nitrospinota bacterium]|nr:Spx/MgsR family RNA polymerase-binding regulatory protein [Nitrospinota bacterium]